MALACERGGMGGTNPAVPLLNHVRSWAAEAPSPDGGTMLDDPLLRERLARTAMANQVSQLLTLRARRSRSNGSSSMVPPSGEGASAAQFRTWFSRGTAGFVPPMTPRSKARATPLHAPPPSNLPRRK